MTVIVSDIIEVMEEIAPVQLAESWDNPGLQVGDKRWPVEKILISLDPTPTVLKNAAEASVNMLITHHPLVFRPLKSVDLETPVGGIVGTAIRNAIAIYAAHTNLDSAEEGLNDFLAARLGLTQLTVLAPHGGEGPDDLSEIQKNGLGRIGDLPEPMELLTLCRTMKQVLGLDSVRLVGDPKRPVSRVAVCTGSGGSLLDRFFSSGADVFVTGDVRYHDARDAEDRQAALIDIGHFGSEHVMVEQLGNRLRAMLAGRRMDVEVLTCDVEKDPFVVL